VELLEAERSDRVHHLEGGGEVLRTIVQARKEMCVQIDVPAHPASTIADFSRLRRRWRLGSKVSRQGLPKRERGRDFAAFDEITGGTTLASSAGAGGPPMKQEIVLPKFKLPGQGPSWPMRALWVAGGLVGLQVAVLGVALSKKRAAQEAALVAAPQAPAVAAPSLGIRAAVAAPAPNDRLGTDTAAPTPTAAEAAAAAAPTGAASSAPIAEKAQKADRPSRSGKRAAVKGRRASSRGGKMLAKATPTSRNAGPARKSDSKNDTIDDLLRRFK
jgi:hypothetical protein